VIHQLEIATKNPNIEHRFIIIGSPRGTGTGGGTPDPPPRNPTGTDFAPFSSPWGEILPQTRH